MYFGVCLCCTSFRSLIALYRAWLLCELYVCVAFLFDCCFPFLFVVFRRSDTRTPARCFLRYPHISFLVVLLPSSCAIVYVLQDFCVLGDQCRLYSNAESNVNASGGSLQSSHETSANRGRYCYSEDDRATDPFRRFPDTTAGGKKR